MIQFKGFKPEAEERIARTMGYSGDMGGFATYLAQNPEKQNIMNNYRSMAMNMVKGGVARKDYFLGGEAKAAVLPSFINPNTGQEYTSKNAAPDPSVLVPADNFNVKGIKGGDPLANMISDQEKFYSGDIGISKPFDYYLPGVYRPDDPQREVNPKYTGGAENVYETPTPEVPDIKKLDLSAFQPKIDKSQYTNIDTGFFDSPEYKKFTSGGDKIGTADVAFSPYFGRQPSGSISGEQDAAYEAYLKRTGQTDMLKGGNKFVAHETYQAPSIGNLQQPSMKVSAGDNLADLYYTDYENPRSDDELKAMYEVAQAQAKAQRDAGFMGMSVLPGEMPFEDYVEMNRYKILPKDQGRPTVGGEMSSTPTPDGGTFVPMPQLPKVGETFGPDEDTGSATPLQDQMAEQAYNPELPYGGAVYAQGIGLQPQQFIPSGSGQLQGQVSADAVQADTFQAKAPTPTGPAQYDATQVSGAMAQQTAGVQAAQAAGLAPEATVSAATQTDSMVSQVTAAQGTGILMDNPAQRKVQSGELVSGAADAQTAAKFTEQVQAAQATPSNQATVQGQLERLLQQFEGGATPAWAAGAMRAATATMAARGLGASSMAGQAVVQAAMESALPVAQADAATRAAFEAQNLSNRQERAMLAAQQRAAFIGMEFDQAFQSRVMNASKVSDIANMNFTAEQQVALENSRIANTINLQNLNNQQAVVMAEAAALSQLDMANLNNRQQAAVMNAQSFLSMDMANLNNRQQVAMFKAQAMQQALFTDQAAVNAAKQFNAKNRLIIDQNNVQWRREVATANTAAINRANEINAKSILDMSETAYNNLWQYYSDSMEYAWTSAENERDRLNKLAQIKLQGDIKADITDLQNDYNSSVAFGNLIGTFLTGGFKTFGNLFGGGS